MKNDWQIKNLGEIIALEYGKPLPKSSRSSDAKYPVYGANGIKSYSDVFYHDKPSIIVGRKGSAGELKITNNKFWPLDVTYFVKFKVKEYDLKFLYLLLLTLNLPRLAKGVKPGINRNDVYSINVGIPPNIEEQERIVKILDEVFEKLEKAKEITEKNIQNSRELFESYLHDIFSKPRKGWKVKRFDEICVLQRGFDLPTRLRKKGHFPLVSSNGITDYTSLWKVKAPGVVTGRSGTIGNIHFISKDFWPLNTSLYIKEFYDNYEKCIFYFLKQFNLAKYKSGAGVPTLNRNNVHSEMVCFPSSIKEQREIVKKLDHLSEQTRKLEENYKKKLADLEELKKSILQKAFTGEL